MKVVQSVFGTFHHFDLARELDRRGHLLAIYSTFPWMRLKREGLLHDKVKTFPWLHMTQFALNSRSLISPQLSGRLGSMNGIWFDRWLALVIPRCDVLIALSGAGLLAGARVQSRGGLFICDRGSTHRKFQMEKLAEEHRLWGMAFEPDDPAEIEREVKTYALADAISVPSTVAKRSFLAQGFAAEKVHVIPYGVRLESFHPTAEPPAGPDAEFRLLFVGNVTLRKGIPYLLQAFAALQHPRKRLTIVGPVADELKPLLGRLPQEHVEFQGALPQAELPALMSTHHMMVLPSIEEGLALVQGQALACGCPVLATRATGAEDLFTDGVEGFIVEDRDTAALTARMQQMADEPGLRARMSAAALERVKSMGGWQQYGANWEALLQRLLAER